jgi:tRNA-modifying protein YgfZ
VAIIFYLKTSPEFTRRFTQAVGSERHYNFYNPMSDLAIHHTSQGATFDAPYSAIPVSFGNNVQALEAANSGAMLVDRSHWGQILVSGEDRLRFLHNQSTADFNALKSGSSCNTVFVNSTGRTIDLALALILENEVMLMVSPGKGNTIFQMLDRYIFFADKVTLQETTQACFSLIGPQSTQILATLQAEIPSGFQQSIDIEGIPVRIVADSGLGLPGYTFFLEAKAAPQIWQKLVALGAIPGGEECWEELRIRQGRPAVDRELTADYNPLEVGLWQTISFTKGCYIGQETIARLNTYKGVKQYLWGIKLEGCAEIGSDLILDNTKVGTLTSCNGQRGLVYLKSKAGGVGLQVQVGDTTGEIVDIPFISHEYYAG